MNYKNAIKPALAGLVATTSIISLSTFAGGKASEFAAPGIDINTAMEYALAASPGNIIEAELDRDNGKLLWEFEIVSADNVVFEVEIDADTGEVLELEQDD